MKKNVFLSFIILIAAVNRIFATPAEKQVTLEVTDSSSIASSDAIVYFDINLNPNYTYPQDSQVIFDTSYAVPQIYSFTNNGVPCYLNGCGNFINSTIVPLGVSVSGGGTYIIKQSQIYNFDPTTMVILEDRQLGTFVDLRIQSYSVNISQSGRTDGRFFLHLSYPPQISDIPADCTNQNGTITITEDSTIRWSLCQVYNSASQLVGSFNNITGNFSFSHLPAGAYSVEFNYGNDAAAKPFYLDGGQISLSISTSYVYAAVGQSINFSAQPVNANTSSYTWDFGDGTIISGVANYSYAYSSRGDYVANFSCSNSYNCAANDSQTMHISFDSTLSVGSISSNDVYISNDNKAVRISISNILQGNYNYEIDNLDGQQLLKGPVTSSDFIVATDNLSSGIYIVTVKNNTGRLSKKIILP